MKLFLDTADVEQIRFWHQTGLIDGVTTNPSHLAKEGGDAKEVVKKICALMPNGQVSVEVTQVEPEAVYKQAKEIAALADNVVVKVPCHRDYYAVIKRLAQEDVPLNITLVFTLIQGMLMCKLGVQYISPFIGRWDDIDVPGIELLYEMRVMVDSYGFETYILAASLRGVRRMHDAILAGADVATVPLDVMDKMTDHPLTDRGMEKFLSDWKKLGITKFP